MGCSFVYLNIELGRGIPNLTLNRIMTGLLVVLILAQFAVRRRKLERFSLVDISLLAFCAASAISVPDAVVGLKSAAQSFFDLLVMPIAIYFLARNLITSRQDFRAVIYTLTVVGLYLAFLATREQLTGEVWFYPEDRSLYYTRSFRRVVGLLGNPAYIAVSIGMGVPWAWYLFLTARRRRLFYLFVVGSMMAGIYFCMNRSGWVGLLVALIVMALFVKRFRRIFVLMVIVGAIVLGVYWVLISGSAAVRERLTAQGPIEYRRQAWEVAWRMIKGNLIFGIGYENYSHYYRRYSYWDIYLRAVPSPHNTYLWVIVMGGLVAFVPFILFLGAMGLSALGFYANAKRENNSPNADLAGTFLASMSAILVPALVMDILTGYYNTMLMFLIMGAFFGAMSGEHQKAKEARLGSRLRSIFVERG